MSIIISLRSRINSLENESSSRFTSYKPYDKRYKIDLLKYTYKGYRDDTVKEMISQIESYTIKRLKNLNIIHKDNSFRYILYDGHENDINELIDQVKGKILLNNDNINLKGSVMSELMINDKLSKLDEYRYIILDYKVDNVWVYHLESTSSSSSNIQSHDQNKRSINFYNNIRTSSSIRNNNDISKTSNESIQSKDSITNSKYEIIGIKNIGNSCYMNSVLQVILRLDIIYEWFEGISEEKVKLMKNNKNMKLSYELYKLIDIIKNKSQSLYIPHSMKKIIDSITDMFKGNDEHDAQEFFLFIMNTLNEEIIQVERLKLPPNDNYKENLNYVNNQNSMIMNKMMGISQTIVECVECKNTSYTYEPYSILSLSIKDDKDQVIDETIIDDKRHNIKDMLDRYISKERLEDDDCIQCDTCKQKKPAMKYNNIVVLPKQYLFIHIKRFQTDISNISESSIVQYRKNNSMIGFDTILDCESLLSPIDESTDTLDKPMKKTKLSYKYRLIGIINHEGDMYNGHYYSYIYNDDKWYECNDEYISVIDNTSIYTNNAYILLYNII